MDYELAKQLKDAGFPPKHYIGARFYHFIAHPRMGIPAQYAVTTQISDTATFHESDDYTYIPILEELIEACGDTWFILHREETTKKWDAQTRWAGNTDNDQYNTPTEAVAKLWLALHKK